MMNIIYCICVGGHHSEWLLLLWGLCV